MATKTVRRKQVRDLTFKLLTEYEQAGWRVRFSNRMTRALGQCDYSNNTISYQVRYIEQNDWREVENTIRHEVAHALAGAWAGHGATWKRWAVKLGANPSSTSSSAKLTRKFTGTCEGCGATWQRDRRMHGAVHPTCSRKRMDEITATGTSEQRCSIRWTRND